MNVMFIGNFIGVGWDGSITDENHIADALEGLGHTVVRSQRDENVHLTHHATEGYDFILIAQWDGYKEGMIPMLKKNYSVCWKHHEPCDCTGPKIVYWAFDYQADGQEWHERLIAEADLYLSKRIADSKYPNWQWLSQDFAPSFLDKYPLPIEKDIDVLFTGSWLDWAHERNATLQAVDHKFNLVINTVNSQSWPGAFRHVRGPIMDEGLPELYARAKIVLSIDHTIEAGYWSDRNAQIMACGGLPLFRYVPLSESTFHNHVDYFYDVEDCLSKIQWRLSVEESGVMEQRMSEAYEYAQANLKVKNRVQDLLTIVEAIL